MLTSVSTPPTILYVEDERPLHRLIEFWLTEAGFQVELAFNGAEALEMIRADPPDLVITDAMMPNLSGDELVEIMKTDEKLAHIPIVMATAAASPFRVEKMLERGCFAVLGKPLDETSFIAAAKDALGLS